jgi:hypothetical protein
MSIGDEMKRAFVLLVLASSAFAQDELPIVEWSAGMAGMICEEAYDPVTLETLPWSDDPACNDPRTGLMPMPDLYPSYWFDVLRGPRGLPIPYDDEDVLALKFAMRHNKWYGMTRWFGDAN